MACPLTSHDLHFLISKMDLEMETTAQGTGVQDVHSANIEYLLHARLCMADIARQEGDDVPLVKHQSEVKGASGASVWAWGLGSSRMLFCLHSRWNKPTALLPLLVGGC